MVGTHGTREVAEVSPRRLPGGGGSEPAAALLAAFPFAIAFLVSLGSAHAWAATGGERPILAVTGDGGFLMNSQELETAVRYGAGITAVVFRNGLHGTIAMHQARDVGKTAGSEIGPVDLAGFARSFGAEGYTVTDPRDLESTLREAVEHEGVSLVDVVTDPDLISPTGRLSELAPKRD